MKIRITKWLGLTAAIILGMSGLDSCVKSRGGLETDFSNISDFVVFQSGGLVNYGSSVISAGPAAPDTVTVTTIVTLASKNVASSPVTVTIGLDDSKRTDYNAANGTSFQALPTNAYKIVTPTVTIPAGQNYATVTVEVYARNVDPSINFLLPVTILDAAGKGLSGNLNTVYYHIIGNPIAGVYTEEWIRWAASDTTGAPQFHFTDDINSFAPETQTQIFVESVDNGADFHISFTNTAGVLSNFKITLDPASYGNFGLTTLVKAPTFIRADPVAGVYRFWFQYQVGAADRTIVEEFVKQ
ncbi:MAG TPA: DUF1735 domain-containing protein [Chitinophagaceae bacterium]|nr:DUF1735 domain-containing protein [Chitinophagaceae bacterium]